MAVAFSSNDQTIIEKEVNSELAQIASDIETCFEIDRCVKWIKENDFKTVALQFPDGLMSFSPKVASSIESYLTQKIYVLGDTSYGECCVDEVAAEHIGADSVIHFGHTCLTKSQRLPVLYVFTDLPMEIEKFRSSFESKFQGSQKKIAVVYDVQYHQKLKAFSTSSSIELALCCPCVPTKTDTEDTSLSLYECGRSWPLDVRDNSWTIVYVGLNENYEALLRFTFNQNEFFCYDPIKEIFLESVVNVSKALMKRYMLVEKTKDAERIGILVGTLGVSRYGNIIDHIRKTVKAASKKAYTFLLGKPNVPKMANFPEIDVFVLVACPENSLVDSKEYLRPIITPFELDVALNGGREWTGQYFANFRDLLPGSKEFVEFSKNEGCDISLISGKVRVDPEEASNENGDFALAVQDTRITQIHKSGGGEYLTQRTWQGLEQKIGETKPALAVEGQKGIAWGYENEGQT